MPRITTDDMLGAMVNVINHAVPKECRPQRYHGDIIRDVQWVTRNNLHLTKWVWFIGDYGTHSCVDKSMWDAIIYSYGDYSRFLWNGKEFKRLEADAPCPL